MDLLEMLHIGPLIPKIFKSSPTWLIKTGHILQTKAVQLIAFCHGLSIHLEPIVGGWCHFLKKKKTLSCLYFNTYMEYLFCYYRPIWLTLLQYYLSI